MGIGLFIALIGFVDAGFVNRIPDIAGTTVPVQLGNTGVGQLQGWPVVVFAVGLVLLVALWVRRVKAAILISIVVTTVVAIVAEAIGDFGTRQESPTGWALVAPEWPDDVVGIDLGTLGEFSLLGSFERAGVVTALLFVFTLMLADFFDTMGTMTAIGAEAGLLDEDGVPPHTERILVVDSVAAAAGGLAGVSSNTSYIESASGVGEGARTGLASVVTGVLFLLTVPFTPLVALVPSEAAVPALVLVGLPDDAAGARHRLGRPGDRDPRVPHDRADALHLLDHRGHRCRLPRLRAHQDRGRQGGRDPAAALGRRRDVRRLLRDPPDHRAAHLTFVEPVETP